MALRSIFKENGMLVIFALIWAITFPYQDWQCAQSYQRLQHTLKEFHPSTHTLPSFGVWEALTKSDFRLKIELLSFYQSIGAKDRAVSWAREIWPESFSQTPATQIIFFEKVLWLDGESNLQAAALSELRQKEPGNPAWLLHQHMLSQNENHMIPALSKPEKSLLSVHLHEIGEGAFAENL